MHATCPYETAVQLLHNIRKKNVYPRASGYTEWDWKSSFPGWLLRAWKWFLNYKLSLFHDTQQNDLSSCSINHFLIWNKNMSILITQTFILYIDKTALSEIWNCSCFRLIYLRSIAKQVLTDYINHSQNLILGGSCHLEDIWEETMTILSVERQANELFGIMVTCLWYEAVGDRARDRPRSKQTLYHWTIETVCVNVIQQNLFKHQLEIKTIYSQTDFVVYSLFQLD